MQTETATTRYVGMDMWPAETVLAELVSGQERAIAAVRSAIPQIARAADAIALRLSNGGRLAYAGAGSSIRIGVLDGSELPATFNMAEDRLFYLVAGGREAMFDTLAEAEDDAAVGSRDAGLVKPRDAVIAIAASGTTPYTLAVARGARERGALVVAVVNNPATPLADAADLAIVLQSGPEVIAGSTRMGAGTAQKAALNLLSTLVHIKLGAVHDGLMVSMQADNAKLKRRACAIVMQIAAVDEGRAAAALAATGNLVKPAVLLLAGARDAAAAQALLDEAKGNLRLALAQLAGP